MVFRKNLRSLERRWEKISKFLGDLPSEQIFYRNIPLGAPVKDVDVLQTKTQPSVHDIIIIKFYCNFCSKRENFALI